MDRRVWGTGVVVLALIAALVVPNLSGRRIVGSGSRIPVPGPPEIGQCLLAAVDGRRSALSYTQATVVAAPVGPCGDANYGEVVSVSTDRHSFPSTVINRMGNPEPLACQPTARRYLGWDVPQDPTAGDRSGSDPAVGVGGDEGVGGRTLGPWRPVSTELFGLLGPNLWQYLSGQGWLACVVYPHTAPYAGTVRGGAAGSAASAYGSCQSGAEPTAPQKIPCDEPHSAETFGTAGGDSTAPDALFASCRDLVIKATGMTDPTAGGELTVAVAVGGNFATSTLPVRPESGSLGPAPSAEPQPARAACIVGVSGERRLGGSLTGVGDGPLPWAS